MTKRLLPFGCLTLLLIGMDSASAEEPNLTPNTRAKLAARQPVKLVCLGDSVTGIYYHTGGRRAYPEMIAVGLKTLDPDSQATVINAGISGNSTVDALKRLQKDVLDHRPDLVTVMFGLNDMTRVPLSEFQANLKSIIEQCRGVGAEVMLCTPNGIYDTPGRPASKLVEYNQAMQEVGRETKTAFCDVYAAYQEARKPKELDFRLMLSDPFHPNMDGHKLNGETILQTLTGKTISLRDAGPPTPLLPVTKQQIEAQQPVRVHAMAPYDQWIAAAIVTNFPDAKVEVTTWQTQDQTLAQLQESAKKVRELSPKPHLVVVAIPAGVTPKLSSPEAEIEHHSWILNYALSFGLQEWDVIAVTPSVLTANLSDDEQAREHFSRRMIFAQDLPMIARPDGSTDDAQTLLTNWLAKSFQQ